MISNAGNYWRFIAVSGGELLRGQAIGILPLQHADFLLSDRALSAPNGGCPCKEAHHGTDDT